MPMKKKLRSNLLFLVWYSLLSVFPPSSLSSLSAHQSLRSFSPPQLQRPVPLNWILSSGSILLSWSFCSKYVFYPFMASLLNQGVSLLLCLSSFLITVPPRDCPHPPCFSERFPSIFGLASAFASISCTPAFSQRRPQVRALGTSCARARDPQFSWLPAPHSLSKSPLPPGFPPLPGFLHRVHASASQLRSRRLAPALVLASSITCPCPGGRRAPHPAGRRPGMGAAGPPVRQLLLRSPGHRQRRVGAA